MGKTKTRTANEGKDAGHKAGKASKKGKTTQPATEAPAALANVPTKTRPNSIRQTIMTMLTGGSNTEEISAVLKEQFPGTKAAEKSGKHIAHYKALMKKAQRSEA